MIQNNYKIIQMIHNHIHNHIHLKILAEHIIFHKQLVTHKNHVVVLQPDVAAVTATTNIQIKTNVPPEASNTKQSSTVNHIASTIAQSNVAKVVVITNKII